MATQVSTRLLNSWRSTIVSGIKAAANLRSISSKAERTARAELLEYQLKELNEFNPQAGEFEQIDEEYKRLASSGQLLSISQTALNMLADGEDVNLQSQLYNVRQLVTELTGMDNKLSGVLEMLEEAAIQISEAGDELRHYCERLDLDPNRLFELEQRISRQISLARKHHVTPEELPNYYQSLLEEQQQLDDQADSLKPCLWRLICIISRRWKRRNGCMTCGNTMRWSLASTLPTACIRWRCRMGCSP